MPQVDTSKNKVKEDPYRKFGIERILRDNSAVPFVKRILFPFKSPVVLDSEDPKKQRVMTHKMSYKTADNAAYAYPRVMPDENGQLKDYGADAFDEALRRRDFIKFDTPEMASNFTKLYKQYWNEIGYEPKVRQ